MAHATGPFYVHVLARATARQHGRAEVDHEEAYRIMDDVAEAYLRGEFRDCEVVVYTGEPGNPPSLRPLNVVIEDARRRDPEWCLSVAEWNAGVMLTATAAGRYLEECGFAGAPRVQREWFGAKSAPGSARHKPGRKPVLPQRLIEQMLDDLRLGRRTVEELRADTLTALVAQYGGSPNTANQARKQALEAF